MYFRVRHTSIMDIELKNSAIQHDTTVLITSFHSEPTAHSYDINIS